MQFTREYASDEEDVEFTRQRSRRTSAARTRRDHGVSSNPTQDEGSESTAAQRTQHSFRQSRGKARALGSSEREESPYSYAYEPGMGRGKLSGPQGGVRMDGDEEEEYLDEGLILSRRGTPIFDEGNMETPSRNTEPYDHGYQDDHEISLRGLISGRMQYGSYDISITMPEDLVSQLRGEYERPTDFDTILTVSGGGIDAYASTCAEYVEWRWPRSPWRFLDNLALGLEDGTSWGSLIDFERGQRGSLRFEFDYQSSSSTTQLSIVADGPAKNLNELLQQIRWFCAVMIPATADIIVVEEPHFDIQNRKLNLNRVWGPKVGEQSCWHQLLPGTVIVDTLIPTRPHDRIREMTLKGLEISFDIMVDLALISHAVEIDGGVILKGFSSALVPVAVVDDCVQWHYVCSRMEYKELTVKHVQSLGLPLVQGVPWYELANMRAILGYYPEIYINACTDTTNFDVEPSKSEFAGSYFSVERGGTLSAGFAKYMTGSLAGKFQFRKATRAKIFERKSVVLDAMFHNAHEKVTVIFDESAKIGWMIPEVCAVLYLSLSRLYQLKPRSVVLQDLPSPSTVWKAGVRTVFRMLKKERLRRGYSNEPDWYITDEVKRILNAFQERRDALVNKSEQEMALFEKKSRMRAWDIGEMMSGADDVKPRAVQMARQNIKRRQDWFQIHNDTNTVVICGNKVAELILPATSEKSCNHRLNPLDHANYNLLAAVAAIKIATENCIGTAALERPMLGKDLFCWRVPDTKLFSSCARRECSCNRVQELRKRRPKRLSERLDLVDCPDGAVMFGPTSKDLPDYPDSSDSYV